MPQPLCNRHAYKREKINHFSIRYQDSNAHLLNHESHPVTTRRHLARLLNLPSRNVSIPIRRVNAILHLVDAEQNSMDDNSSKNHHGYSQEEPMHVYYLESLSLQNIKTVPGDDKASKECPSLGSRIAMASLTT